MPALTVAVLSDLHFFVRDEKTSQAHSHLPVDARDEEIAEGARGVRHNPLDDLLDLVERDGLRADVLLCPGDITTRANPIALRAGWHHLGRVAEALGATMLCAATGNHDVDSRSQKPQVDANPIRNLSGVAGPLEALKLLDPLYPVHWVDALCAPAEPRTTQSRYFGESFALHDSDPRYRVLVFNSCADHGHDNFEYERGTVPKSALRWIRDDIGALRGEKINLLLAHHPLVPQSTMDGDTYSFAAGGDQLMRALESVNDDWLIIHGHKHHGELRNGTSESNLGITIFSAASFSAFIPDPPEGAENQFYLLDLDRVGGRLCGHVRAWNWYMRDQWRTAPPGKETGVFNDCGFGGALNPRQLAAAIQSQFAAGNHHWAGIRGAIPELAHTLPNAWRLARVCLRRDHGLEIDIDDDGHWVGVSKGVP